MSKRFPTKPAKLPGLLPGYRHDNHKKPVTRRELLGQGFLAGGAALLVPSLLGGFSRRALGDTTLVCQASSTAGTATVPVIIIDLAGGGNIAGTNVIVGGAGGQMDTLPAGSYASIGLAASAEPGAAGITPNTDYGLAFHPTSKMLAGMNQYAVASTRTGVEGAIFCAVSGDDTRTNPLSPIYWLAKAGLNGQLVPLVGSEGGASGGNSAAPQDSIDSADQPSTITQPSDALGLVDPGKLATLLGAGGAADTASVKKVMAAITSMSAARLAQFQTQDVPTQVQDLIQCGYINGEGYLSKFTPANLDPTQDAKVTALFTGIASDSTQAAAATIAKLVLDGYAGAGVITLGGYDYHGQGRAAQDAKDLYAGQMIGRVLQLAAAKATPVMVIVYTDGGVSANGGADVNGILAFSGDSGARSSAVTLAYKPGGTKPTLRQANMRQIGAFNSTGAVDATNCLISNNTENLSLALAANWMALMGTEGNMATALGVNPFGTALDSYLPFTKIV